MTLEDQNIIDIDYNELNSNREKQDVKQHEIDMKHVTVFWREINWTILYFTVILPFIKFMMEDTVLRWLDEIFYANMKGIFLVLAFILCVAFAWPIPFTPKNDPMRISLGCFLTIVPSVILSICSVITVQGLLFRGGLMVSMLCEGVATDAKGGRVPSKKDVVKAETPYGIFKFLKYKE